jgi:hypothetical protein
MTPQIIVDGHIIHNFPKVEIILILNRHTPAHADHYVPVISVAELQNCDTKTSKMYH